MKIKVTRTGSTAILTLEGRMDAESSGQFDQACNTELTQGAVNLVADLKSLAYISSAGLGIFARLAADLKDRGGEIVLTSPHGLVREVFELTHVITIFRVFESPEAAVASLV